MTDNYIYKPDAIDMILGKGMLLNNDCNIQDITVMFHKRYRIIAEAAWFPNIGKYSPMVRTIAYIPKDVQEKYGRVAGNNKLSYNLTAMSSFMRTFDNEDYYKVLSAAIRIARLYLLREIIYKEDEEMLKIIHDQVKYEAVTRVLDLCDNPDCKRGMIDYINDELDKEYITGSIHWELTKYIKENGFDNW